MAREAVWGAKRKAADGKFKPRALYQAVSFIALAMISVVFLAPVVWIGLTALKTQREALAPIS